MVHWNVWKYHEQLLQISHKIWREYLSGNWQQWSNLHELLSLFRFGRSVFKVALTWFCLGSLSGCCRVSWQLATGKLPANNYYWPANSSVGRGSSGHKTLGIPQWKTGLGNCDTRHLQPVTFNVSCPKYRPKNKNILPMPEFEPRFIDYATLRLVTMPLRSPGSVQVSMPPNTVPTIL
jgi:hypothetical protein